MDGALVTTEVALACLLVAVLATVVYVWVRRRRIAAGGPLMSCAVREGAGPRWRLGLIRLSGDTLDWFSVIGPTFSPEHRWARHELDLGTAAPVPQRIPGLEDPVAVGGFCGGLSCTLAMDRGSYYAVRAWLEASPPGRGVNVA